MRNRRSGLELKEKLSTERNKAEREGPVSGPDLKKYVAKKSILQITAGVETVRYVHVHIHNLILKPT